jgi:group I intron endonuclease
MALVYGFTNTVNQRVYIGCTKYDLAKRAREHRCLLRNGKHTEPALQADWDRYGSDAFDMRVLEEVADDIKARREAELRWMDAVGDRLYNTLRISYQLTPEARAKGVANAHNEPGLRWTPEANLKRRLAQLGKPKGHGAKISATKRLRRLQKR